ASASWSSGRAPPATPAPRRDRHRRGVRRHNVHLRGVGLRAGRPAPQALRVLRSPVLRHGRGRGARARPVMEVMDAISGLRATRVYQDRPVPADVLDRVLEAATMACSAGNTQPWELVVVTDGATKARLKRGLSE